MSILAEKVVYEPVAKRVNFTDDFFILYLADGREIWVPLEFYPRLKNATKEQREAYEIIGLGTGIHWPEIDEDLSVEGIIEGRPSKF